MMVESVISDKCQRIFLPSIRFPISNRLSTQRLQECFTERAVKKINKTPSISSYHSDTQSLKHSPGTPTSSNKWDSMKKLKCLRLWWLKWKQFCLKRPWLLMQFLWFLKILFVFVVINAVKLLYYLLCNSPNTFFASKPIMFLRMNIV